MKINYAMRSRFMDKCHEAIEANRSELDNGGTVTVIFEKGGYDNHTIISIDKHTSNQFQTDLELNDSTRFPARIKAAATALRDCECYGRFEIAHKNGVLSIRQV
jgi:hypothetical protein